MLAMSIDMLADFAGRTSLGHGAIFGVSTYVVIYTVVDARPPAGGRLRCSAFLLPRLSAAVFALLAVRTSGVYFLLLTLALGMIVWGVCLRWTARDRRRERPARRSARRLFCRPRGRSIGSCSPAPPRFRRDVAACAARPSG